MLKTKTEHFFKLLAVLMFALTAVTALSYAFIPSAKQSTAAISSLGSSGAEVKAIQEKLKERGLFNESITGYYGEKTQAAVKKFQKQQGISQTGTAGPLTLQALGISVGTIPAATESNIYLLARIISAEARGEPYTGQVAVGAVILNRIEHPSFPDTLSGVIYQNGAFTAIVDGQFNEPIADSAYSAARDALNGWDPTNGCIYYYNPAKTSNSFMWSRPTVLTIGSHRFCT
jgi:N-acetylmuramoyl-L-alanine amidase